MTSRERRCGAVPDGRRPPAVGRFGHGRRTVLRALTAVAALAAAAGCGVRPTSVPVDAGPAPSRASCAAPEGRTPSERQDDTVAGEVHLVCGSRVLAVHRTVRLPRDANPTDRLDVARALLHELQRQPTGAEAKAGFTTDVPDGLRVTGPREGDPSTALRLSSEPTELPAFALAQLVCTYAGTAAGGTDRSVVLGGPAPDSARPYLRYECDSALRTDPKVAQTAGVAL